MNLSNVLSMLGGVALFLFGMSLMGDGLKKVAGNKLEIFLYKLTNTRFKGMFLGTAVTTVIQSSAATTVMVIGFVNSGMMNLSQSISIILGANFGTSITGWIICLSTVEGTGWLTLVSTATLSAIVAFIGIILWMFSKSVVRKHVGGVMLGFSVLMYGMQIMSSAVSPLKESASFQDIMTFFSNPIIGIVIGILISGILQSASASVGILQALAMTGNVSYSIAIPVIMGIAVGASVPVLLSAIGASKNGKRAAFIYLFCNILGVLTLAPLYYLFDFIFAFPIMEAATTPVTVAVINSIFRFASMLILLPFVKQIEAFSKMIIRDSKVKNPEESFTEALEERFIEHPALAIEQSRNAMTDMAKTAHRNLSLSISMIDSYSDTAFNEVQTRENIIDKYEDKLGTYLVKLTGKELSPQQSKEISKFLHTISDFERIGDHAVNIADVAKEINEKGLKFSFEAQHELEVIITALSEIVNMSFDAFIRSDTELAYRVEPLEELIDILCDELKLHHINRVQTGNCTLMQGFVFNDLITGFERIADHCSNIAVALIELESDSFDTHEYLSSVKTMRSGNFNRYFEEYKLKYSI